MKTSDIKRKIKQCGFETDKNLTVIDRDGEVTIFFSSSFGDIDLFIPTGMKRGGVELPAVMDSDILHWKELPKELTEEYITDFSLVKPEPIPDIEELQEIKIDLKLHRQLTAVCAPPDSNRLPLMHLYYNNEDQELVATNGFALIKHWIAFDMPTMIVPRYVPKTKIYHKDDVSFLVWDDGTVLRIGNKSYPDYAPVCQLPKGAVIQQLPPMPKNLPKSDNVYLCFRNGKPVSIASHLHSFPEWELIPDNQIVSSIYRTISFNVLPDIVKNDSSNGLELQTLQGLDNPVFVTTERYLCVVMPTHHQR